ncbi:MAG: hypothetical protein CL543_09135 [Alcanivorax sp.]|nr:hypothetical protein [Alcanivorax sp.]MAY12014.1 hypothetical protein [Alcanivorax sp.]MBI55616.1 hypothetical protein [Alcanivorax sp.]MBU59031.1 hypothetical protein [Alcanivorax sp.]|tara:strand:+ start:1414 stop:1899 length:486 start_codon:yes stop_codon:yes gene_type:complete
MSRRRWKTRVPTGLRQAMEWCKEYARDVHNLSVERIAEGMGMADHWTLYKWLQNGRMPAVMVPAYERTCGINFVSRWLAASGGRLVVEIPTGKKASARDVMSLQSEVGNAIAALIDFYEGKTESDATLAKLQGAMEGLAHHHRNVEQHRTPELPLNLEDDS